ncbi:MAG TPA: hypothetical protein VJ901_14885 [Thermoanaerobaculia bacterium]|nr:hypothetical protein [Thermoanaerobaculia bacterium]
MPRTISDPYEKSGTSDSTRTRPFVTFARKRICTSCSGASGKS